MRRSSHREVESQIKLNTIFKLVDSTTLVRFTIPTILCTTPSAAPALEISPQEEVACSRGRAPFSGADYGHGGCDG
jgi:hypothetical protein